MLLTGLESSPVAPSSCGSNQVETEPDCGGAAASGQQTPHLVFRPTRLTQEVGLPGSLLDRTSRGACLMPTREEQDVENQFGTGRLQVGVATDPDAGA